MVGQYKAMLYNTRARAPDLDRPVRSAMTTPRHPDQSTQAREAGDTALDPRGGDVWSTATSRGTLRTMNCSEVQIQYSTLNIYDSAMAHTSAPPDGQSPGSDCPLFLIQGPQRLQSNKHSGKRATTARHNSVTSVLHSQVMDCALDRDKLYSQCPSSKLAGIYGRT